MQSNGQLEKTFKRIGYAPNTRKIALRELANTLSSNESVLAVIEATAESTVGILLATDLRVLFVGCSPLKDSVIRTISYTEVLGIESKQTDFSCSEIEIQKSGENLKVIDCDPDMSKLFINLVKEISEERKNRAQDQNDLHY